MRSVCPLAFIFHPAVRRVWRPSSFILLSVGLAMAALAGGGCAHHCGYTDTRMTIASLRSGETRRQQPGRMLIVLQQPAADQPILRVALFRELVVERRVRKEFSGVEVRVPYHWSALAIKPILPVSLVLAFWMPFRQPHVHDAGIWRMGDYLRDFVAWLNPFEAIPSGSQEEHGERVVFRAENGWMPVQRLPAPVRRESVGVFADGKLVATMTTDADGEAALDVRTVVGKIANSAQTVLTLRAEGASCRVALAP